MDLEVSRGLISCPVATNGARAQESVRFAEFGLDRHILPLFLALPTPGLGRQPLLPPPLSCQKLMGLACLRQSICVLLWDNNRINRKYENQRETQLLVHYRDRAAGHNGKNFALGMACDLGQGIRLV